MENNEVIIKKNNKGLIVIIFILIIAVLGLIGYIAYNKFYSEAPKTNKETIKKVTDNKGKYEFGKEVVFEKLNDFEIYDGYTEDFSKFNILSDDDKYVTLYMQKAWNKISIDDIDIQNEYDGIKKAFSERGIEFGENGEVRGINKEELSLLGCDIVSEECKNIPAWASYSLTGKIDGHYYSFPGTQAYQGIKIVLMDGDDSLIYFNPVIKVLKTNIK